MEKCKKNRRSIRLRGYDYSSEGFYFVTICTYENIHYFGEIVKDTMKLSKMGMIVEKCWFDIPKHFPFVVLDEFVVMPNHLHGIIIIDKNVGQVGAQNLAPVQCRGARAQNFTPVRCQGVGAQNFTPVHDDEVQSNRFGPQSKNLASIIRGFKIGVSKYAKENSIPFKWHRGYYDHIIRTQKSLENIRQYIVDNPLKWQLDRNNIDIF